MDTCSCKGRNLLNITSVEKECLHKTKSLKSFNWQSWATKPEDHWSCIAHLSAEDLLKSAVTEEKKFKNNPWAGADNPLGPKFCCQQEGLITMVICCNFEKNLFNL